MNFPVVFAQQTPAPSGGLSMTGFLIQIAAIIAIFYFIVIRPQQKERRNLENALLALKKGDEVVTSGGIVAEVVHLQIQPPKDGKESGPTMADRITIRSGESKLIVERGRIGRVVTKDK